MQFLAVENSVINEQIEMKEHESKFSVNQVEMYGVNAVEETKNCCYAHTHGGISTESIQSLEIMSAAIATRSIHYLHLSDYLM